MTKRHAAAALVLLALAAAVAVVLLRKPARPASRGRLDGFPKVVLWAWERPEDLRFLNPREAGVAFLATTLFLYGDQVSVRPRLQPLQFPEGTALMAVARIETDRSVPPALSAGQIARAVPAITEPARLPGVRALQIDFDATLSQRPFYRRLLEELRRALPESTALSITALASWCWGDDWLSGLPIEEAVPMLFRMGPGGHQVLERLQAGDGFRTALCQGSIGISTDEPAPAVPAGRRVYLFHPQPWSPVAFQEIRARNAGTF
ncbi:MAG TPA: DUF3142 domain-containing protein [Bryobacterales bacterium]|nr:DUF3142 domain-containing protein [Bryobacterales bacterium]